MAARQTELTHSQAVEIRKLLANSDLSTAIEELICEINFHLSTPPEVENEIEQHEIEAARLLQEISKMSKRLSEILSEGAPKSGESLSANRLALSYIWVFQEDIYRSRPDYVNFHSLVEPLARVSRNAERSFAEHPYSGHVAKRGKNKNIPVRYFVKSLVFSYQKRLARLPSLSVNSKDYEVMRIACNAYGYFADDMLNLFKAANKERKSSLGDLIAGKGYKVKLGQN